MLAVPERPVERDEEQQPERAGQVAEDAQEQVDPADPSQTPRKQHHAVLQVSLAPPAVAPGVFNDVLRRLLVAALQLVGKPNLPVLLEQQRGLDKIVAEDLAAKGFAARQAAAGRNIA